MKHRLALTPAPATTPDISLLLGVLHEARARTLATVSEPRRDPDTPLPGGHSLGTLLYHVAAIELDWLYSEVRQQDFPPAAQAWFPQDVRDAAGRLSAVTGEPLAPRGAPRRADGPVRRGRRLRRIPLNSGTPGKTPAVPPYRGICFLSSSLRPC